MSKSAFEVILEQLRADLAQNGHELVWSLNGEASEESLVACETATGIALPGDFRDFLRATNGVSIRIDAEPYYSADLEIYSTGEIVERDRDLGPRFCELVASAEFDIPLGSDPSRVAPEESWSRLLPFAHYGIGDCLFYVASGIESTATIVDLDFDHMERAINSTIAQTFHEWLSRVVESIRSQYHVAYWLPDP